MSLILRVIAPVMVFSSLVWGSVFLEKGDRDRGPEDGPPVLAVVDSIPSDDGRRFFEAADLATNEAGEIYIADKSGYQIVHMDAEGRVLNAQGRQGEGPGEFRSRPSFIDYADGNLFVSDHRAKRIHVYGEDLERREPIVVADFLPGGVAADATGRVLATVRGLRQYQPVVVDASGATIAQCEPRLEEDSRMFRFPRLLFAEGKLYALYVFRNVVEVFSQDCTWEQSYTISEAPARSETRNLGRRDLPRESVFRDLSWRNGRLYLLLREPTEGGGSRIVFLNPETGMTRTMRVPHPARAIHWTADDHLLTVGAEGLTLFRYAVQDS